MSVRIKICGITRLEDALYCEEVGIDALGFIFYPQSKRYIAPHQAAAIIRRLSPLLTTVGLVVNPTREELSELLKTVPVELVQFHGEETPAFCAACPRPYIKALRLEGGEDFLRLEEDFAGASGLLYDAYSPVSYGGTGKVWDWSLLPKAHTRPWILAGGLTPDNIETALSATRAKNIDLAGGVESAPGIKDRRKIDALIAGVKAFEQVSLSR